MNEKIRECWLTSAREDCGDSWDSQEEFIERFAKSVVKECVRYFNEEYTRDFDTLWREDLSKGIKQHFGVKNETLA